MPVAFQEKLIQWILFPFSRIIEKIPVRIRNAAFSLSVLGIALMEFARNSGLYTGRFLYLYIVAYLLFGVMILAGLTPELKPVRFSPILTFFWLGVAFFMALTGFLVNADAFADAILWFCVLPILYLVWSQQNLDRMVSLIIHGVLISFLVFSIASIFFFPINSINYSSFFLNRNRTSLYLVPVFICVFTYILSVKKISLRVFLADILLGFVFATIYYTNCRTGIVAVAFCFISAGFFHFCLHRKNWRHVLLSQLLPAIAAIVLLMPSAIYVYHGGYQLKTSIQEWLTPPPAAPTEPAPTEPAPTEPAPTEPPSTVLDTMKDYNDQRFDATEKNLDKYTAGRAELWRIHLEQVGLLGNPSDKVLYKADGSVESRSAHFTIIQFAYDYGVFAGIFFLALNLLAGFSSIRYAVKRRDLKYALWPFASAIAFGANSVMEAIGHPAQNTLDLLYFLSLTPILVSLETITSDRRGRQQKKYL